MAHYEYELLTLKQIPSPKEHDYRWHSDRQGVIGHPHEIAQLMNARGEQGWHIGTHVADGRWGNMIILERLVPGDQPAAVVPPAPVAAPAVGGGVAAPVPDAVVLGLQAIQQSLQGLARQMAQMPPVVVQAPALQPPVVMQTVDPQLAPVLALLREQLARMEPVPTVVPEPVPVQAVKRDWLLALKQWFRLAPQPEAVAA